MADFNPKTIKGNIGGVYFTKTKEAVDPFNLTKYNPNTNQNIILFYLEDGVENNVVTVNFAPNDSSMPKKGWTSHDFPAIFRGYVDHTVNGEAIPRTFAQYLALVPTLITDLNLNNKNPLSFNATVIQSSGVNLLGSFNTLNDLINAHTPTESLHDNDAIAYVYENGQNGFYKVYFSSGSSTWYWGVYQGAISTSLSEVQYNLTGLQVQGGFRNPAPIVPLQDEQYRIIWQHLNELYAQYSVIEGELGELAQEIIELNTAVVKSISKTDTNTIIIGLTRIDNNVNIHAVVNVSSNSYNLLKVVDSGGLEVNPEDIINEIVFEINNTNSTLRQAIDDIVDGKIATHNINSEAHQDIRDDIETAEQNANEYTDEEVAKKVDLIADQNIGGVKNFTDFLNYKGKQVLTTETGNIYSQQIADLQANKLNKIWADITEQATTNLTDILVFNRGSNVYKTTIANLLAHVAVVELFTVVAELPEVGLPNKIYLVPSSDPETQNALDEFIWIENDWEMIGNVSVDLSDYFNKTEINSMLESKVDKNATITPGTHPKITYDAKGLVTGGSALVASDIPTLEISKVTNLQSSLDNKVDKIEGKGLSTNDYTNTAKQSVEKIPTIEQDILDLESDKIDKNNPITAGTKAKITYDSKGLVTSGADLAEADIPALSASKISSGTFDTARIPNLAISKITSLQATLDTIETSKQDKLVAGENITIEDNVISASGGGEVDLNAMAYFNYAGSIYGDKYSLLKNAWEHSLTVDPLEISEADFSGNQRGIAQYPSGEIEGVIIPQGVTSIGSNVFSNWKANNQPLIIPSSVTNIGSSAFAYWEANNQPLVIPNSVTNIKIAAFRNWSSNTHPLVIPSSVTEIGRNAFHSWLLVPYVEIQAITPPTLVSSEAFIGQNDAPIYVPDESVDDYKTATNWVNLADRIFSINDK